MSGLVQNGFRPELRIVGPSILHFSHFVPYTTMALLHAQSLERIASRFGVLCRPERCRRPSTVLALPQPYPTIGRSEIIRHIGFERKNMGDTSRRPPPQQPKQSDDRRGCSQIGMAQCTKLAQRHRAGNDGIKSIAQQTNRNRRCPPWRG
jgi:hypothetical protein